MCFQWNLFIIESVMLVGLRLKDLPVMNANSFINFEMAKICQLCVVL